VGRVSEFELPWMRLAQDRLTLVNQVSINADYTKLHNATPRTLKSYKSQF